MNWKQLYTIKRGMSRRYCYVFIALEVFKQDKFTLYEAWLASHKPFHWFIEFYGIMKTGGFDIVIGNPPWVEYSKVSKEYKVRHCETEACGNLHGMCTERGLQIRSVYGRMSFIVQLPLVSSSRMVEVRNVLRCCSAALHVIPCDDRPGKLFDGLEHCRAVIWLSCGKAKRSEASCQVWTTKYQRWPTDFHPVLFQQVEYAPGTGELIYPDQFPKYAAVLQNDIFARVKLAGSETVGRWLAKHHTDQFIFYQEATQYWVKATVGLPYYSKNGKVGAPPHGRYLYLEEAAPAYSICALLHSSLFYSYFVAYGDCFHLSDTLVRGFRVTSAITENTGLVALGNDLMRALKAGAEQKEIRTKKDGFRISYAEYYGWKAKGCIDEIDHVLAQHYGFTDEELDFVINYDIKYRMGREQESSEGPLND